jgi:hypothetical protein
MAVAGLTALAALAAGFFTGCVRVHERDSFRHGIENNTGLLQSNDGAISGRRGRISLLKEKKYRNLKISGFSQNFSFGETGFACQATLTLPEKAGFRPLFPRLSPKPGWVLGKVLSLAVSIPPAAPAGSLTTALLMRKQDPKECGR